MFQERPVFYMSALDCGGTSPKLPPEQSPDIDPQRERIIGTITFYVDASASIQAHLDESQKTLLIDGETQLISEVGLKYGGDFTKVNPLEERDLHFNGGKSMTPKILQVRELRAGLIETGLSLSYSGTILTSVFVNSLEFLKEKRQGLPENKTKKHSFSTSGPQQYTSLKGHMNALRRSGHSGIRF